MENQRAFSLMIKVSGHSSTRARASEARSKAFIDQTESDSCEDGMGERSNVGEAGIVAQIPIA